MWALISNCVTLSKWQTACFLSCWPTVCFVILCFLNSWVKWQVGEGIWMRICLLFTFSFNCLLNNVTIFTLTSWGLLYYFICFLTGGSRDPSIVSFSCVCFSMCGRVIKVQAILVTYYSSLKWNSPRALSIVLHQWLGLLWSYLPTFLFLHDMICWKKCASICFEVAVVLWTILTHERADLPMLTILLLDICIHDVMFIFPDEW